MELNDICWTTRAQVREQLLTYLLKTPADSSDVIDGLQEDPSELRRRVTDLICLMSDETSAGALRQIALNGMEVLPVRYRAIHALRRLDATVPVREIRKLLEDRTLYGEPEDAFLDLRLLCRSADAQRMARKFLGRLSPAQRRRLVARTGSRDGEPPELIDWLYYRWLREDRLLLGEQPDEDRLTNPMVARSTRDRTESCLLLLEVLAAHRRGGTDQVPGRQPAPPLLPRHPR